MNGNIESTEGFEPGDFGYTRWCVVYDGETGEVVHLHQNVAMTEADACSPDELAEQAMDQAAAHHDTERLRVAHPSEDLALEPNGSYAVDLESGAVIPAEKR